jgi:hypothetical protein
MLLHCCYTAVTLLLHCCYQLNEVSLQVGVGVGVAVREEDRVLIMLQHHLREGDRGEWGQNGVRMVVEWCQKGVTMVSEWW